MTSPPVTSPLSKRGGCVFSLSPTQKRWPRTECGVASHAVAAHLLKAGDRRQDHVKLLDSGRGRPTARLYTLDRFRFFRRGSVREGVVGPPRRPLTPRPRPEQNTGVRTRCPFFPCPQTFSSLRGGIGQTPRVVLPRRDCNRPAISRLSRQKCENTKIFIFHSELLRDTPLYIDSEWSIRLTVRTLTFGDLGSRGLTPSDPFRVRPPIGRFWRPGRSSGPSPQPPLENFFGQDPPNLG